MIHIWLLLIVLYLKAPPVLYFHKHYIPFFLEQAQAQMHQHVLLKNFVSVYLYSIYFSQK